jgi:hypothetical protein
MFCMHSEIVVPKQQCPGIGNPRKNIILPIFPGVMHSRHSPHAFISRNCGMRQPTKPHSGIQNKIEICMSASQDASGVGACTCVYVCVCHYFPSFRMHAYEHIYTFQQESIKDASMFLRVCMRASMKPSTLSRTIHIRTSQH